MSVGYAKLPAFTYHNFDAKNIRFTNIPLWEAKKSEEPAKEEPEPEAKPDDAADGW